MHEIKKLKYAPGMISLVGLLFFIPYAYKRLLPEKQTMVQLIVPRDGEPLNQRPLSYYAGYILKTIKRKNKINIILDENVESNRKKLELIQFEARKLKYAFDTSHVIEINFPDNCDYGEFVKLLNICLIDSIRRYATWENHFVIFGEYPPTTMKADSSFTQLFCCDVIPPPAPEKSFAEKLLTSRTPYRHYQTISLLSGWLILATTFLYSRRKNPRVLH